MPLAKACKESPVILITSQREQTKSLLREMSIGRSDSRF